MSTRTVTSVLLLALIPAACSGSELSSFPPDPSRTPVPETPDVGSSPSGLVPSSRPVSTAVPSPSATVRSWISKPRLNQPEVKAKIEAKVAAGVRSGPNKLAQAYALRRIGAVQFNCLYQLWSRESGWRTTAQNSSSGAYGIPQALPGSKMAIAGDDWRTNPITQVKWGLGYISGRYGNACKAWSFFLSRGWY